MLNTITFISQTSIVGERGSSSLLDLISLIDSWPTSGGLDLESDDWKQQLVYEELKGNHYYIDISVSLR